MSEDHELQKLLLVPNAIALVLFFRVQAEILQVHFFLFFLLLYKLRH
jgi:hypothetical protein